MDERIKILGRKAVKVAARAADMASRIDRIRPINIMTMGVGALDAYLDQRESSPDSIFRNGWMTIPIDSHIAHSLIAPQHGAVMLAQDSDTTARMLPIGGGLTLGLLHSTWYGYVYIRGTNDAQAALDAFGRWVWEQHGASLTLTIEGDRPVILRDELYTAKPSSVGDDLLGVCKAYRRASRPLAIMLYGCPGDGKSTALKYICAQMRTTSLRIPTHMLQSLAPSIVRVAVMLRPEVIIIDDLDHAHASTQLLSTLEELRRYCGLVLASANDLDFHPAVLRPGRFDIVCPMLSDETTKVKMVEALPDVLRASTMSLPMAYINAVVDAYQLMGEQHARARLDAYLRMLSHDEPSSAPHPTKETQQ